jgi:hypothetical protein
MAFIELEAAATVAPAASTTVVGIVQLTDSTSSTSTTTAATPNSVKSAYDLAGTAIPKNTVTAAGDILYASGSATVARLGIGTASQVLSVSGGVPAWTTPAGGGGMTLIATATPSAATSLSFTSIPGTYKHLKLIFFGVHQSVYDVYWQMRLNNNSGSVYRYNYVAGAGNTGLLIARRSSTAFGGGESGQESVIPMTYNDGSIDNATGRGEINIYRYAELEKRIVNYNSVGFYNSGNTPIFTQANGIYTESGTAITSIDFIRSSTQTITGNFYLYGVS